MSARRVHQAHTLTRRDADRYLRIGITAQEVIRLRWPDASYELADHLLWEHTPFPIVRGLDDLADRLPTVECDCEAAT